MKNRAIVPFLILICIANVLSAQTTIPDAIFEDYLETHTIDGTLVSVGDANSMGDGIANNSLVLTDQINMVTFLDVGGLGILDLTGIEDFVNLETLICSNNNLSNLDISNNTNLVSLLCGSNFLSSITISNNLNLESLNCSDNQIEELDLASNLALESLTASDNQLVSIDVSNNTNLNLLSISNNRITGDLLIDNNPDLESLFCSANQITGLDLSIHTVLKNLDVSDNALTALDLSFVNSVVCPDPQTDPVTICQSLATFNVSRNQLSSLIVANGYNELFASINSTENPDLYCIQIDSGFTPSSWLKDDWTYYSENTCVDIYTYVPDDNFEQALINLGYDDALDNLVLTANIDNIIDLNVSNASISSLIGLEDFLALEVLDCSNNSLESINVSANTNLQELDLENNNLELLDVSTNTALIILNCSFNAISQLDLSSNLDIVALNCSNNLLSSLEIDSNVNLTNLDCSMNEMERLVIVSNVAITNLQCSNNNLFALDISNGSNNLMTDFNATNNANLFCIKVDDVTFANAAAGWQKDVSASYELDCGTYVPDDNFEQALIDQGIDSDGVLNNFVPTADIIGVTILDISSLSIQDLTGIEDFIALEDLNCSNNSLLDLDLSNNIALEVLDCSMNQIDDMDFTLNTALTSLLCGNNTLGSLNIENGNNATLTVFNSTGNPNLFCINVDNAIVGNIPASWQSDVFTSYDGDCLNNRITLIPDPFFEQSLIDFGYDDVVNGQVLTANIEQVEILDVSDKSISDLTGIRDFKSLIELDCSSNFLDALDVSDMIFLERLNCSSNYLLTNDAANVNGLFNTAGTISLIELYCSNNNLNDLDTSQNLNLELLDCADNNLNILVVSGNALLRELNCSNNNLLTLDISTNTTVETVNCDSNAISTLVTSGVNNTTLMSLSCVNNDLSNLTVSNYVGLVSLSCGSNELTDLNVTNNTLLEFLSISNNQISEINLSNNSNLIEALLSQNNLTDLDLTSNSDLEFVNCDFNEITSINLTPNSLIKSLSCSDNQLTDLDLTSHINLMALNVSANALTSLSLSGDLSVLKTIDLSNNEIQGGIDLSTMALSACVFQANQTEFCPETISINISNNLLEFVNVQNGINEDIVNFNATGNPNLECIQVDDANAIGINWIKDETASYNEDCNFGETYVPDDNFEQALINLGYDSGPLNDYVLTANIETLLSLDINSNSISDLTGIEDFIALESFNCSNNAIAEIDLSSNTNLLVVNCSGNQLIDLDVSNNAALTMLNCSSNLISSLDLSANLNLIDLDMSSNNVSSFSPSEVLSLQIFNCDNNQISDLDFQQNQNLTSLSCQSNLLETLNIRNSQNTILLSLNAQNNPELICIETDTGMIPSGATWSIDATAQFSVECFFGETYVPDDNFEQALIDLGYDSGPLDDYVLTEHIEDLAFLNISGYEIANLTGIEDFINLASLDVEENNLVSVDFSHNILLSNLDVSDNLIEVINISVLPNLTTLDVSSNSISQLSVDANLNLINLDISNNLISSIAVSMLFNLEDFNCAFNQLDSLDLTQNPNLTLLFCQSNMLVGDQLNLQNGNNENLQVFNATNNPGLGCILVDNPVAVVTNEDGLYDNWTKDDSASYQTICEDADNDGVPNADDLCPGTEFGVPVDLFGCAIIDLPNDNFMITVTGETCLNSNNGKITIVAQELYNYTVSLFSEDFIEPTGEDFYQEYNFTNDVDIFNLLAGTYEMCITIEEWPNYESCYTIVITQPDPLEVFANRAPLGNEVSVDMSGSTSYNIDFNGEQFTTHNSSLSLPLQNGMNHLKVSTDLECQGVYEKQIFVTDGFAVYPNPFNDFVYIHNGKKDENVTVSLYSTYGQLVFSETYINKGVEKRVNTNDLATGIYLVTVQSDSTTSTYKMVKK